MARLTQLAVQTLPWGCMLLNIK